jgi:hypothetical protein
MGSVSSGKSKSGIATKEVPGVFGTPDAARIAGLAQEQIGQRGESPLSALLSQALTGGGPTAAETGLQQAVGQAVGGGDISQALAPALIGARGSGIANLLQALGTQQQTGAQGRGQTLQGLLQLAELAMPQVVAGQITKAESKPDMKGFLDPGGALLNQLGVKGGFRL